MRYLFGFLLMLMIVAVMRSGFIAAMLMAAAAMVLALFALFFVQALTVVRAERDDQWEEHP